MDFLSHLLTWYMTLGPLLLVVSVLINMYAYHLAVSEAIEMESIRCGLAVEHAKENSAWQNGIYALIAWPISVWKIVSDLIS